VPRRLSYKFDGPLVQHDLARHGKNKRGGLAVSFEVILAGTGIDFVLLSRLHSGRSCDVALE